MSWELKLGTLADNFTVVCNQLNTVKELLSVQSEKLENVMDNMTLSTVQQGKLQRAVKARVNQLLGGAHSTEYKKHSRLYFVNIWNDAKEKFSCGSRWQDLNPAFFTDALDYIVNWSYGSF